MRFLSTPSARRATPPDLLDADALVISIHALREEGDPPVPEAGRPGADISIHALREEGDLWPCCAFTTAIISIHALREEGDSGITVGQYVSDQFLSTPSARRATESRGESIADMQEFLSTPSARRATAVSPPSATMLQNFYPRPPRGGRQPFHFLLFYS